MVHFFRRDKNEVVITAESDKSRKSERRYAAFMFVPAYLLVFRLVLFFFDYPAVYFERYESTLHYENVHSGREITALKSDMTFGTVDEPAEDGRIELNSASEKLLDTLPKIGPQKAKRISEKRAEMNGFKSVDDLLNVDGIGEKTLNEFRDLVYVEK